ncbi:MAG TPA: response regulator [Saprospiraceae bacterium]|nr:response regulator [Saprospiraceae bacterium]
MHIEPIHILLADDDENDRLIFNDAFEEIKIKTVVNMVKDGIELMQYLQTPGTKIPHLLFLDLNMPRKGGMECLMEIKKLDCFKDLAIAIYSTSASDEDVEETFIRGANVYIKKPSDFEQLKRILTKVITINWQYHTSGLNRDVFLLNL